MCLWLLCMGGLLCVLLLCRFGLLRVVLLCRLGLLLCVLLLCRFGLLRVLLLCRFGLLRVLLLCRLGLLRVLLLCRLGLLLCGFSFLLMLSLRMIFLPLFLPCVGGSSRSESQNQYSCRNREPHVRHLEFECSCSVPLRDSRVCPK